MCISPATADRGYAISGNFLYRGDGHDAVRNVGIVERGEIHSTPVDEFQRCLLVQHERVGALNGVDGLFRFLDGARMARGMGDHGICALELGGRSNVEQRGIGGQRGISGARKEFLVGVAEISHDCRRMQEWEEERE